MVTASGVMEDFSSKKTRRYLSASSRLLEVFICIRHFCLRLMWQTHAHADLGLSFRGFLYGVRVDSPNPNYRVPVLVYVAALGSALLSSLDRWEEPQRHTTLGE